MPFGLSHDEQFRLLHNRDTFHSIAARAVSSLIAVMNPETLALTGTLVQPEDVEIIRKECLNYIPEMHMPQMRLLNDPDENYMFGLISMTLESLSYSLQLVKTEVTKTITMRRGMLDIWIRKRKTEDARWRALSSLGP